MTARSRKIIFLIAGALLLVAFVWHVLLAQNGIAPRIARQINAYGYNLHADDIYSAADWENATIRELLPDDDLTGAVEASTKVNLPSNIDRRGQVTLILAQAGADTLSVFYVDGELELAFMQRGGVIFPLGA